MMPTDVAHDRLVAFLADPTVDVNRDESPASASVAVTSTDHSGRRTVTVVGRLVVRHVGEVRSTLAEVIDVDRDEVLVDLTNLVDLDAAGLIALTAPLMASRRRGVRVTLVRPRSTEANRMLTLTGIVPSLTGTR